MKFSFSMLLVVVSACFLAACGAGSSGSNPCGASSQSFGVDFASSTASMKVGTPATISTTVTPESCRADMTFDVTDGTILQSKTSLPLGLTLSNGNVTGTPTTAGTYKFAIQVSAVKNYSAFAALSYPHSRQLTLTVAP